MGTAQRQYDLTRAGAWTYDIQNQQHLYDSLLKTYESGKALLANTLIRAPVDGVVLAVKTTAGSFVSTQGSYGTYTEGYGPVVVMAPSEAYYQVRCYIDEILITKLPSLSQYDRPDVPEGKHRQHAPGIRSDSALRESQNRVVEQRPERVDLRVLPVCSDSSRRKDASVYPGMLVDVYLEAKDGARGATGRGRREREQWFTSGWRREVRSRKLEARSGNMRLRLINGVQLIRRTRRLAYLIFCALLVAGCAVGPDFVRPKPPPVTRYTHERTPQETAVADGQAQRFETGAKVIEKWWWLFKSPAIDAVVRKAVNENQTLQSALASLRQSQDNLIAGYGVFFPQLNGVFDYQREKFSPAQFGASGLIAKGSTFNLFTLNGTVSYVLDIFGGERRQVEGLAAQTEHQRQTARATYLTLIGNTVNAYIAGAAYQAQIQATEQIIAFEKEQVQITEKQVQAGTTPYSNVLAVRAQLTASEAALPPLRKSLSQSRHLLTALVGQTPEQWAPPPFDLTEINLPVEVPVTLPSQFIHRRPDILSAEAQLHSASANIGVATAAMFPSITLSGNYGYNSTDITKLFGTPANFWSLGADLATPIFHGGSLWFQRKAAIQAYNASLSDYKQAVIAGFQQVADALRALQLDASTLQAQSESLATAEETLKLTTVNYRSGLANYLQVLTADNQYQQARLGHIQAQALRLQDTTALFVALGGGWWEPCATEAPKPGPPGTGKWLPRPALTGLTSKGKRVRAKDLLTGFTGLTGLTAKIRRRLLLAPRPNRLFLCS